MSIPDTCLRHELFNHIKYKQGVDIVASEKFTEISRENKMKQHLKTKANAKEESTRFKIEINSLSQDSKENTTAVSSRLLRTIRNTIFRRGVNPGSLGSSGSSDSMSGDNGGNNERSSNSEGESGSGGSGHDRPLLIVSLRRIYQSLVLTSCSLSATATHRLKQARKQKQPKCILRPPVRYTYVRGLSGLPTKRVPRYAVISKSTGI